MTNCEIDALLQEEGVDLRPLWWAMTCEALVNDRWEGGIDDPFYLIVRDPCKDILDQSRELT